MEISGKKLQEKLIEDLKSKIINLKSKGITPGIAIVTLGPEETWEAYVGQKIKLAEKLGANKKLINLRPKSTEDVVKVVETLNANPSIHGLIVQRPFPTYIDTNKVIQSISKGKDIDGFRDDSLFDVPVWLAVKYIITHTSGVLNEAEFKIWASNQTFLIVGRGETAGKPVIKALKKLKIEPMVIDSKTQNPNEQFKKADIIISAVGKSNVIPLNKLKKESILIGIGLHRENDKLVGDFDDFEAEKLGLTYTPSPGGVGPLNLAFLFENLIEATISILDR